MTTAERAKTTVLEFDGLTVKQSAVSYNTGRLFDVFRNDQYRGRILRVKTGFSAKSASGNFHTVYPTMEAAAIAQDK